MQWSLVWYFVVCFQDDLETWRSLLYPSSTYTDLILKWRLENSSRKKTDERYSIVKLLMVVIDLPRVHRPRLILLRRLANPFRECGEWKIRRHKGMDSAQLPTLRSCSKASLVVESNEKYFLSMVSLDLLFLQNSGHHVFGNIWDTFFGLKGEFFSAKGHHVFGNIWETSFGLKKVFYLFSKHLRNFFLKNDGMCLSFSFKWMRKKRSNF